MGSNDAPLKGTLYASLATSSESKQLTLRCSQKVRAPFPPDPAC